MKKEYNEIEFEIVYFDGEIFLNMSSDDGTPDWGEDEGESGLI